VPACPPACPPAYSPAAPAPMQLGVVMICMVCDGNTWRPATEGEHNTCELRPWFYLDTLCVPYSRQAPVPPPPSHHAAPCHTGGQNSTNEPWFWFYCDHIRGWRPPHNVYERLQSHYLPNSHRGKQCWYPLP
jgi:hypothetical protein